MKVFGLAGWSGSGKTTLVLGILPLLTGIGLRVSTVKHAHHHFDVDKPGKDSFRHREAGATEVLVASSSRWALMHELRDEAEPSVEDLLARMTPVDLLIIEGFKQHRHPKLEIHRPSVGKPPIWPNDPDIVAVASDVALEGVPVPVLALDDHAAIVAFILSATGLAQVE